VWRRLRSDGVDGGEEAAWVAEKKLEEVAQRGSGAANLGAAAAMEAEAAHK
jgi:hypothetical protein